jgi:NAD+ kinase
MLRAVRELDGRDTPLIGVNLGALGFLTSVAEEDLERALECLARDDFEVESRAVAECAVVRGDSVLARYRGLNEVVVSRRPTSRIASISVTVGRDPVTSYLCDGLIVATPTGSTGHSLSAGGPILLPGTSAFVVSLICPHTLSSRPLVIPDGAEVRIMPGDAGEGLLLTVDGQVDRGLEGDETILVRRARTGVKLIRLPGYSYFAVLRHKLGWRGSNV